MGSFTRFIDLIVIVTHMPPKNSEIMEHASYFDAHSDMLELAVEERALSKEQPLHDEFLPGMLESNIDFRLAAISVPDHLLPEMALRRALKMVTTLNNEVEDSDAFELATNASDLEEAVGNNTRTLILGMEGAEPFRGDLDVLDVFYRLGLRLITLTHARRNELADGAFYTPRQTGTRGGLTDVGVEVVERASEKGIVIDVSHLNKIGFWDVLEFADDPIVASHSNCRAIADVSRNLTDDQLRAIANSGGVTGMALVGTFIGDDASMEAFLDHVDHAVDVAGIDHVGFGFDFADYLAKYRPGWDPEDPPFGGTGVPGLDNDQEIQNLAPALQKRGYSKEEVDKLTHQNFLRVFDEILE